jgi:hypothetical protein
LGSHHAEESSIAPIVLVLVVSRVKSIIRAIFVVVTTPTIVSTIISIVGIISTIVPIVIGIWRIAKRDPPIDSVRHAVRRNHRWVDGLLAWAPSLLG